MRTDRAVGVVAGIEERKRLGQFFTGVRLGRLLAALVGAGDVRTIIDPMAGTGDLLVAARQAGATGAELTGVEIDSCAALRCRERLTQEGHSASRLVIGDAFAPQTWAEIGRDAWDLVIANPPYVRYQRTAGRSNGRVSVPSADDVRRGLMAILGGRSAFTEADRNVFQVVASAYSGLADMAVPAWLLCASLVAVDGRLAMVVPGTWLSRDYALPVLYLMRRFFEIECVVEDGHGVWFGDALVRTTLLVARRVEDRKSAVISRSAGYVHVVLDSTTIDGRSVVGQVYPAAESPDRDFATRVRAIGSTRGCYETRGVLAKWVPDSHFASLIQAQAQRMAWIQNVEPTYQSHSVRLSNHSLSHIPRQIYEVLGLSPLHMGTIADCGWCVGQGLRTGCNLFFYVEAIQEAGDATLISLAPAFSCKPLWSPSALLRRVVRKQRDLSRASGFAEDSHGRVLVLSRHALPEDIEATRKRIGGCPYTVIPEPLARHIRHAASRQLGTGRDSRRLPELSAVRTNVRVADTSNPNRPPGFWYQLPELTQRHIPDLFIPRINHERPQAWINRGGTVIDANFSTLWRERPDAMEPMAMLALLHSTWALAAIEASSTVLGGGGLKVEATHLRRLPFPTTCRGDAERLAMLGSALVSRKAGERDRSLAVIDEIVTRHVIGVDADIKGQTEAIRDLATELMRRRK